MKILGDWKNPGGVFVFTPWDADQFMQNYR
jgi:hypothetical protein